MPAFHYRVIATSGKEQKGVIEAESEKHARQLLREKSLIPLHVQLSHEKKSLQPKANRFFRRGGKTLTVKELSLFTTQFATLLSAGLPIEECLQAVAEQTEKPRLQALILSVRSKVVEGHSLAGALKEYPDEFSALFCATVAAGEITGHLDKVLLRLAEYTEQQWHMQQKLKSALIYPVTIVFVAISIVGFLLEYVVPKMVAVYGNLHQTLPTMTEVLIGISNFAKSYSLYILFFLIAGTFMWRRALKKYPAFRERAHYWLLRIPLFGRASKTANTARFSRTLAILSSSGVPALEAMNIAAKLITIIPIQKAVEVAVSRVREGAAIHQALKQTNYFTPMSVHMIASGEASGQLEGMLERVAINQEDEVSRLIEVALALFEPAIILVMGSVVLFIVLAVLLPIFQLNDFAG